MIMDLVDINPDSYTVYMCTTAINWAEETELLKRKIGVPYSSHVSHNSIVEYPNVFEYVLSSIIGSWRWKTNEAKSEGLVFIQTHCNVRCCLRWHKNIMVMITAGTIPSCAFMLHYNKSKIFLLLVPIQMNGHKWKTGSDTWSVRMVQSGLHVSLTSAVCTE